MDRKPESLVLQLSAQAATADAASRTISGLAVPYGPVGNSSMGPITFSQGSLSWSNVGRVKYLKQHDPERSLGHAVSLQDTPDGLRSRLSVAPGPEGDLSLAEGTDGRRDGLSVGVRLSEDSINTIWDKQINGDTSPTAASGELLEISQVSLPAFSSARLDGSEAEAPLAASMPEHLTLAVTFGTPIPSATAVEIPTKEIHMNVETPVSAAAVPVVETPAGPVAFAGNAQIVSEAPVYTFDGKGASFARDAFNARMSGDNEAHARLTKFNAMMADSPAQVGLLTAAVETRATAPAVIQNGYKPELLLAAIDKGRPLVSRLSVVTLHDATPFRLPAEGNFHKDGVFADAATTSASKTVTSATAGFSSDDIGVPLSGAGIPAGAVILKVNSATSVNLSQAATATATGVTITISRSGVGDHTEGTAHAAEGDLDITDVTINPGAVSGAFRLSRELIDASNPALDQVALRAMLRDYRWKTEAKVVAALAAASATPLATRNTVAKVRSSLNSFYDVMDEPASFFAMNGSYYSTLLDDVDTTGRPMLSSVNPTNAVGTASPGWTGANIDGVEFVKSGRIGQDAGYFVKSDDILVGESAVQTFRFDEVEGPGVVKLALFSYFAAKALRGSSVQAITSV